MQCPHCGTPISRKDINHVIISGEVASDPTVIQIRHNKEMLLFTIRVVENFVSDGERREHRNFLTVEVLGRNVDKYKTTIRRGRRYVLTGYFRNDDIDGVERTRIRAFNINEE